MVNKIFELFQLVVVDVYDGVIIMIGGFGMVGMLFELIDVLIEQGVCDLMIVNNNVGNGEMGFVVLLKVKKVCKIICLFLCQSDLQVFDVLYCVGEIELEFVLQGNFVECICVVGVGIGGFFMLMGYGIKFVEGKEMCVIDGKLYVFEMLIYVDFVLVKVYKGDCWGNFVYCKIVCNFGLIMVSVVKVVIVQVLEVVLFGVLNLEYIVMLGIFVQWIVEVLQVVYVVELVVEYVVL